MHKLLSRTLIILIWLALISCALYWPTWKVIPHDQNTINVFAWGDILEPKVVDAFEKETGIKVKINYYSSNEELIVKLKATEGVGYDLIIPSDYAIPTLIESGLIKKLDKSQLHFWNVLNPSLIGHFFDPENQYSIPFEWEIYGLGIDKDFFRDRPLNPSWRMIFDPTVVDYKISMINDALEAVEFASFYLFGIQESLRESQIEQIKDTLVTQRNWVTAYANFRGDYFLATRNCPVVIASSSYIWKTMRLFDFVGFVIPKEGTFITIENLCIPARSEKEKLVYQFMNFLFRPESIATHITSYGYFPSTTDAIDLIHPDPQAAQLMRSTPAEFQRFHFLQRIIPQEEIRDIWVEVKSGDF